ncbi:DUF2569 domain-containing protein [Pantoea sp. LS15]|uniref:DUF2569 domain-containing protein n=1 Tax=Enterobacterales TaxID=91347 RepID=UPI000E0E761D|nr:MULTISPECIES: DUF2569 domain-containing protein [Enterobacterales]MDV0594526.1 DUF2569 domain-containing protein [Enterobacter sp. 23-M-SZ-13]NJQ18572.1 DUF2569 domain-containing protein [Pantoea sp. LS15]NKF45168.1 DUF2569 domain-containing protein [Pantoea sp. LS15]RDK16612.1 DUF2569 domain-containing protein [Enterobacter sp. 9-2]
MTNSTFQWTCIKCDKEIPQHLEYCSECEEKRYRKIGGLLYLPFVNMLLIAYAYFNSMAVTLSAGMETVGRLPVSQTTYLFVASGINLVFLLFIIYIVSLFLRKKKELPLAYCALLVSGIALMLIDRVATSYIFPQISLNMAQIMPIIMHVIYACIWIPYFRTSVRVKKTFIR